MQPNSNTTKARQILALCGVALVLFVGYNIYKTSQQSGKVPVDVTVVPSDAKVLAGNQKIGNGRAYLKAGTYTVTVSKDGFATSTTTVRINATNNYIQVALDAVSAKAKAWETQNQAAYLDFEGKVGATSRETGEIFTQNNPIIKLLPFKNLVYDIGYASPDNEHIVLTIHGYTAAQRAAALQQIRDWGYDPTDYKLIFSEFVNPLGAAQ